MLHHHRLAVAQVHGLLVLIQSQLGMPLQLVDLGLGNRNARPVGPALPHLGQVAGCLLQPFLLAAQRSPNQADCLAISPPRPILPLQALELAKHALRCVFLACLHGHIEEQQAQAKVIRLPLCQLVADALGRSHLAKRQIGAEQGKQQPILVGRRMPVQFLLLTLQFRPAVLAAALPQLTQSHQLPVHSLAQLLTGFRQQSGRDVGLPLPVGPVNRSHPERHILRVLHAGFLERLFPAPWLALDSEGCGAKDGNRAVVRTHLGQLIQDGWQLGPVAFAGRQLALVEDHGSCQQRQGGDRSWSSAFRRFFGRRTA